MINVSLKHNVLRKQPCERENTKELAGKSVADAPILERNGIAIAFRVRLKIKGSGGGIIPQRMNSGSAIRAEAMRMFI